MKISGHKTKSSSLGGYILCNCSDAAFMKLVADARFAKQSVEEVARRKASNILRSLEMRQG